MSGVDRLLAAVHQLKQLKTEAKSPLELKAIEDIARQLAGEAEVALTTYTGFTRKVIRQGLVTDE